MSEKQFLAQVIELATRFGYKVEHIFEQYQYARRTSKGFPDLLMVRLNADGISARLLFAEIKGRKGKTSEEQEDWIRILKAAKQEVYLWTEDTDTLEQIAEILRR